MNDATKPSALSQFPVVLDLPIQWGDLDAYGHVNHLVYLKWFESARAEYASRVGVDVLPQQRNGYGAIVAGVSCKYIRQMSYPGKVFAGVRVTKLSIGGIALEFRVVDGRTGVPVAEGGCDAVLYDYIKGQPVPIPDSIRAAVEQLEGKRFPSS